MYRITETTEQFIHRLKLGLMGSLLHNMCILTDIPNLQVACFAFLAIQLLWEHGKVWWSNFLRTIYLTQHNVFYIGYVQRHTNNNTLKCVAHKTSKKFMKKSQISISLLLYYESAYNRNFRFTLLNTLINLF